MRPLNRIQTVLLTGIAIFLLTSFSAQAQQLAKRLILKDGSYQLATKWEKKADRVRYFSAERSEWEEIPNSLVDWDATDKYEKDRAAGKPAPEAVVLDKELEAERQGADASTQGSQKAQQPEQPWDRFRIIRVDSKQGKRVVGDIKIAVYGKVSQNQKLVPITAEKLTGGWVKVTPTTALAPGEYAVAEMLGKEGMNLFVWDFGVNPSAPANAMSWKPEPSATPDKAKGLDKRQ